jgi:hypothetical protein
MKKRRFVDRVSVERTTLSLINDGSFGDAVLVGLSQSAINTWASRGKIPENSPIMRLLFEIAAKSSLIVDNSRDSFRDEQSCAFDDCKLLVRTLQAHLARLEKDC